jgi:uncharacterized membrane protein
MEKILPYVLILHVVSGLIALATGATALVAAKGRPVHRKAGRAYVWAMTLVFVTALALAGFRFNRFLFMIAFLSYYSVFAGVRALALKTLHGNQDPAWFDWAAGLVNAGMNVVFVGFGVQILVDDPQRIPAALMYLGFGMGGWIISYVNLKPFVARPKAAYHWYLTHTGNMMGGYIATCTAFLATLVSRFQIPYPLLAFVLPSLIGIPVLLWWQHRKEQTFKNPGSA